MTRTYSSGSIGVGTLLRAVGSTECGDLQVLVSAVLRGNRHRRRMARPCPTPPVRIVWEHLGPFAKARLLSGVRLAVSAPPGTRPRRVRGGHVSDTAPLSGAGGRAI
jgi:hypothetical protein